MLSSVVDVENFEVVVVVVDGMVVVVDGTVVVVEADGTEEAVVGGVVEGIPLCCVQNSNKITYF